MDPHSVVDWSMAALAGSLALFFVACSIVGCGAVILGAYRELKKGEDKDS